ncbi:hypothetical protein CJ195_16495 [Bacillus sp. UMB0899]|nr:hypothetical protein CJ195_16495 [Bacillus sp. UMB0899]
MNTIFTVIIFIQTLMFGAMLYMIKQINEFIKSSTKEQSNQSNKREQEPLLNPLKKFPQVTLKSINLDKAEIVLENNTKNNYLFIFISPGCSACKELIQKLLTLTNVANNIKPIIVSISLDNLDDYIDLVEVEKIPVVVSEELIRKIGVRGFPTVIFTGEKLEVIDIFLGANIYRLENLFKKIA